MRRAHRLWPGIVVGLALLSTVSASERTTTNCPPGGSLIAEFDVDGRAAVAEAVPGLGISPGLTAGGIVADGVEQMPPTGTYHLVAYRCIPPNELALLGRLGVATPATLEGVLHVISPTGYETWYVHVDFGGLRVPSP
jgi:hypothetical protein